MVKAGPPLISIIMPAHNAGPFIAEAIESVLNQTHANWELLIMDDASIDQTGAVAQTFKDERIHYNLLSPVGHPAGVRNAGLKIAKGEYIAFLDADDVYLITALESLLGSLEGNPNATAAYGFALMMDADGNPLRPSVSLTQLPDGSTALPGDYQHTWDNVLMSKTSCLLGGLLLRQETARRVGLFNETLYGPEDYEFFLRLFLDHFEGIIAIPHYIYSYRIHAASLTKSPNHVSRIMASLAKIFTWFFSNPDLPPEILALESKIYTNCYRYQARERLINGQIELCRQIIWHALCHSKVSKLNWAKYCLPLLVRSAIPTTVNRALITARWEIRHWSQHHAVRLKSSQPPQAPKKSTVMETAA